MASSSREKQKALHSLCASKRQGVLFQWEAESRWKQTKNFNRNEQADGSYKDAHKAQERETEANKREHGMCRTSNAATLSSYFHTQVALGRLVLEYHL